MSEREHRRSEHGSGGGGTSSGATPGRRTLTEGLSRPPVQLQPRAGAAPAGDGPVTDHVPDQVELRRASFGFQLPAGLVLSSDWTHAASTQHGCGVNIEVSADHLRVTCSPSVYIDATWPGQNMRFHGATYNFRTATTTVDVRTIGGLGEGFVDATDTVREKVTELITTALRGSAAARPGYNPLSDPDLAATVGRIQSNFDSQPRAPGAASIGPGQLQRVNASVTVASRSQIEHAAGSDAAVRVAGGGDITIRVQGAGSVADIANAGNPNAAAAAARFESATVSSNAITIFSDGEAIVRLQELQIQRGGNVRVTDIELLGKALRWAQNEEGVRFLIGLFGLAARGVPAEAAAHITAASDSTRATIVPGITRATIENAIAGALRTFVTQNPNPGGIDVGHILGMDAAPSGATPGR